MVNNMFSCYLYDAAHSDRSDCMEETKERRNSPYYRTSVNVSMISGRELLYLNFDFNYGEIVPSVSYPEYSKLDVRFPCAYDPFAILIVDLKLSRCEAFW